MLRSPNKNGPTRRLSGTRRRVQLEMGEREKAAQLVAFFLFPDVRNGSKGDLQRACLRGPLLSGNQT